MPELPEVEAARRVTQACCCGRKIVAADAAEDMKVIQGVSPRALVDALRGRVLVAAHRKGKNLWFELDQRPWPAFHFGMAGALLVKGTKSAVYKRSLVADGVEWPPKYLKLLLQFEDGVELAFTDARRFARIRLQQDPMSEVPVSALGWDALLELPDTDAFAHALRARARAPIKALLLDQAFSAGIGNWIADEVLYQSHIHPQEPAGGLSQEQCTRLRTAISTVLELAVRVNADSTQFPSWWLFHQRWSKGRRPQEENNRKKGTALTTDAGHAVEFVTVGGRTSAFIPALQVLSSSSSLTELGRPSASESLSRQVNNNAMAPTRKRALAQGGRGGGGGGKGGTQRAKDDNKGTTSGQAATEEEEEVKEPPRRRKGKKGPQALLAEEEKEALLPRKTQQQTTGGETTTRRSGRAQRSSIIAHHPTLAKVVTVAVTQEEEEGLAEEGSHRATATVAGHVSEDSRAPAAPVAGHVAPRRRSRRATQQISKAGGGDFSGVEGTS